MKASPFPDFLPPSPQSCTHVARLLSALHGAPTRRARAKYAATRTRSDEHGSQTCGNVPDVLDALVRTVLSQNTTNANSTRAMAQLLDRFGGSWRCIWKAPLHEVSAAIACGGLGNVKGQRIQAILNSVLAQHGSLSLDHLHTLDDDDAYRELLKFDGVGPKTASCVLLFCLGRDSFAVDTHVLRITKRLGWVPAQATREQAFFHLDGRIPKKLKYPLHVLMVRHGKRCRDCAANNRPQLAQDGPCPLPPP